MEQTARLPLFPTGAQVNSAGHLVVGGCDATELAARFGTPLYVYDEAQLRRNCQEVKGEFGKRYPNSRVIFACKAATLKAVLKVVQEEGFGLDIVSGGELSIAHAAGFPTAEICFPGNNKSADELRLALELGVGRIVVDNFHELAMLSEMAGDRDRKVDILLRLTPNVDPHTHKYTITGSLDSKFGLPLDRADEAVKMVMATPALNLMGFHFHIGSQIFEVDPYVGALEHVLDIAAELTKKYHFSLKELSMGGGFAVQYVLDQPAPAIAYYADPITATLKARAAKLHLPLPKLIIEPGRFIVARAGVAIYTIGSMKEIPGVRTYVAVDGGMADNIRPALYQAKLEAVVANRMRASTTGKYTIAGKFCESGDILITDIELPAPASNDLLAVPVCGAYNIPESMNYNAFYKPAVVMVRDGRARLIRRRETVDDLLRTENEID